MVQTAGNIPEKTDLSARSLLRIKKIEINLITNQKETIRRERTWKRTKEKIDRIIKARRVLTLETVSVGFHIITKESSRGKKISG